MSRTLQRMRERVSGKLADDRTDRHQLLDIATVLLLLADRLTSVDDCDVEGHAFPQAPAEDALYQSLAELRAIGATAQTLQLGEIRERLIRVDATLQTLLQACSQESDHDARSARDY
ncbi:MAG TPA: hypothetical protein VF221_08685 [Chloroflexota bacterium]